MDEENMENITHKNVSKLGRICLQ